MMTTGFHTATASRTDLHGPALALPDPLDPDLPGDAVVVTTRRAISRVALVAAETAGRFQREQVPHDPMTWMFAPRDLFGGRSAMDACLQRDECLRGVLLHGLSLGLDADPAALDALTSDEGDEEADWDDEIDWTDGPDGEGPEVPFGNVVPFVRPAPAQASARLFTATMVARNGPETVHAFHASLARNEREVASRLSMRMGAVSESAVIKTGVDVSGPLVASLVSPAILDMLLLVAADPASPLAAGLDLTVEQRFLG